ncbi:MAG: hypothetical protein JNN00_15260 [Chitinophagaceae bacterium]|nr:hypothetical protein [Chitinophagaceae bacterium]
MRWLLLYLVAVVDCNAQSKWVVENYHYLGKLYPASIVPMIHYETYNDWYAELRYNYEEAGTVSFFGGKTLTAAGDMQLSITPLLGYSAGRFTGVSAAVNTDITWQQLYLSSQSQYSFAVKKNAENLFFNWSELAYHVSPYFFSGVTVQYTRQDGIRDAEPGVLAGVSFKNISIPVYSFSPFSAGRYFIIGLYCELSTAGKRSSIK